MGNTSENAANYWYSNPRMNLTDLLVNYANEVNKPKDWIDDPKVSQDVKAFIKKYRDYHLDLFYKQSVLTNDRKNNRRYHHP